MSATKCAALRKLLSDGRWHSMQEMQDAGGFRYGGRVEEIRKGKDGLPPLDIETRGHGNAFEYRARIQAAASPPSVGRAPLMSGGASFSGEKRFRDESARRCVITYEREEQASVISQRHTTSSRRPGVDIHGSVRVLPQSAVRVEMAASCPCGTVNPCGTGRHCQATGHARCGCEVAP